MHTYIIILATMILAVTHNQEAKAEEIFKHGFLVSSSVGDSTSDITGKHLDYGHFIGTNPEDITEENANILDALIERSTSFGYNLRYIPETGWGYEVGIYKTRIKSPRQEIALKHDDGSAFTQNTATGPVDIVVDSPSSEVETIDIYFGGLYIFTAVRGVSPYVGAGYAKTKGKWTKSYYSGVPGDPEYGTKGETDVDGSYRALKAGLNFHNGFSLEFVYSRHEFQADAFRSLNRNGAKVKHRKNAINLIYHF